MDETHDPIQPDELDGLLAQFAAFGPCALAVSGGSDSTALMVLFAERLRLRGQDIGGHTVLTIDHGLREGSAAEARCVAAAADRLGYRHAMLRWEGHKPHTGIQAAARTARYRLIGDYMHAHGISVLLTAHTRDDQAETLLMRLARGSGLDGLCAMAPMSRLAEGGPGCSQPGGSARWVARPFLDVSKACLRATLRARGIGWIEDPTNAAPEFERARLRAARAHLEALGLTPAMLALSAARLARARRAIAGIVDQLCDPCTGVVRADPCGVIVIDRTRLRQAGDEIALRVLDRAIAAAGGAGKQVPLGKLEAVLAAICGPGAAASGRWTLARALITAQPSVVEVEREPGREPLPALTVAPGSAALWDGRFWVTVASGFASGSVQVCGLGEPDLRDLRRRGLIAGGSRGRAASAVPSIWHKGRLIAVPSLGFWAAPHTPEELGAVFVGIGNSRNPPNSDGLHRAAAVGRSRMPS